MPAKIRRCASCQRTCTTDHLGLTLALVAGTTRISYTPLAICSEASLRQWARDTWWHAGAAPAGSTDV